MNFVCAQVVEDGYEFFAKRQLVTLFSAPNYCGEFDNAGGMMTVDASLMCSFQVSVLRYNKQRSILSGSYFGMKSLLSDFETIRKESEISIQWHKFRTTQSAEKCATGWRK